MKKETKEYKNRFQPGDRPWNYGLKGCYSNETITKMSKFQKERFVNPENHPQWKGDNVGYQGIHRWLRITYGKAYKCENNNCNYKNPKMFEWANISGIYKRDRSHYKMLCSSCHKKLDYTEQKREKIRNIMIGDKRGFKPGHKYYPAKKIRRTIEEKEKNNTI